MKKILSIFLSIVMLLSSLSAFAVAADAASFSEELKAKGFPDSYISSLVTLHNKYPNWNFEVFNTGLTWSAAVAGERSSHSKQLIQKQSSLSSAYYCNCSSCYKNGAYVPQEGSTWISASEAAVKYYMDPRNWLTEKYIFQFESTSYDSSQTQAGVETIIASTWMKNANISYVNTEGKTVTYKNSSGNTVKYSAAIMDAAKNSGMSAYYLASKIVQEVGGTKATAGGAVGTRLPFIGIYNYYNIGANSGASEGLSWAAGFLKSTKAATLYSSYDSTKKVGSGTKTAVKANQYMTYIGEYGNYYKVRLYDELSSNSFSTNGAVGYILKSTLRTTYFNYGRPWTDPYKAIYYGATYIANSFSKYQNTGYLQKFNVNKNSGNLYNHEYMANVQAAAAESVTTYNAYNSAGILSTAKTFYIPVYSGMPSSKCTVSSSSSSSSTTTTTAAATAKVTGLTLSSRTTTSLNFTWTKVSGATKYYVYVTNNTKGTTFNKTVTTNSATLSGLTAANEYSVKVRAYTAKGGWGAYSAVNTKHALPTTVSGLKASARASTSITLSWTKMPGADGYYVYRYSGGKYTKVKTITSGSTTKATLTGLTSGTTYYYYVSAYTVDASTKEGGKGTKLTTSTTASTTTAKVTGLTLKSRTTTSLNFTWTKVSGATKYYVYVKNNTKGTTFTKTVTTNSATLSGLTAANEYSVKVRAYTAKGGWGTYSAVNTKHTLPGKVTGLTTSARTTSTVTLKWTKMAGADGYYVYRYSGGKYTKIKTIKGGSTVTAKITGLKAGTNYVYAVAAYTTDASTKTGTKSSKLTTCAKPATVKIGKLTSPSSTKLKLTWTKATGSATGYQIYYARDKAFKNVVGTKVVSGQSTVTYTGKNFTKGVTYYVKIRAYKTVGKTKYYGAWSSVVSVKSK